MLVIIKTSKSIPMSLHLVKLIMTIKLNKPKNVLHLNQEVEDNYLESIKKRKREQEFCLIFLKLKLVIKIQYGKILNLVDLKRWELI